MMSQNYYQTTEERKLDKILSLGLSPDMYWK